MSAQLKSQQTGGNVAHAFIDANFDPRERRAGQHPHMCEYLVCELLDHDKHAAAVACQGCGASLLVYRAVPERQDTCSMHSADCSNQRGCCRPGSQAQSFNCTHAQSARHIVSLALQTVQVHNTKPWLVKIVQMWYKQGPASTTLKCEGYALGRPASNRLTLMPKCIRDARVLVLLDFIQHFVTSMPEQVTDTIPPTQSSLWIRTRTAIDTNAHTWRFACRSQEASCAAQFCTHIGAR